MKRSAKSNVKAAAKKAANVERVPVIALFVNPIDHFAHSLCTHFPTNASLADIVDTFIAETDTKNIAHAYQLFQVPIDEPGTHQARLTFRDRRFDSAFLDGTCKKIEPKARLCAEQLSQNSAVCFVVDTLHESCAHDISLCANVFCNKSGSLVRVAYRFCGNCTFGHVETILRMACQDVKKSTNIKVGGESCKFDSKLATILHENTELTVNYHI